MDGENDAAQSGQPSTAEQAAETQGGGNPADTGGAEVPATEVAAEAAADPSAAEQEPAAGTADYEAQIAERDSRISELESQLKNQQIDHELALAGCYSTRAAHALLDEHDGDIAALKEAEPWLFTSEEAAGGAAGDAAAGGTTGLPPTGSDANASTIARWERLAGLTENDDKE